MKWILTTLSVLMLWGAVAYVVIYIEPETLRDVGIEGLYLPFIMLVGMAVGYTVLVIAQSWLMAIVIAGLLSLALVLSITQLMSWFTLLIIILLIIFSLYLHKRRDSPSESRDGAK